MVLCSMHGGPESRPWCSISLLFSALTTLVSWRYHFAVSHYGRFILEQVLPASGIKERTRDPRKQQSIYDDPTLADLGSPYYPQNAQRYLPETDWVNPVGSDYLGVWHYTREIVHGDDPYKNPGMLIYNRSSVDARTIKRPERSRAKYLGCLSYLPTGPFLVMPFYKENYFLSLLIYLASLMAFVVLLGALLVRRSKGIPRAGIPAPGNLVSHLLSSGYPCRPR